MVQFADKNLQERRKNETRNSFNVIYIFSVFIYVERL